MKNGTVPIFLTQGQTERTPFFWLNVDTYV